VEVHKIDEIYLMAALLSATAENPAFAWDLNMNSLFHLAKAKNKKNILAIEYCCFGPTTPKENNTPSWSRPRYTESASNLVKDEYYHNIFWWM
jgi:hypothetical protein